jgi:inhibitor of cysteine peptidase
MAEVEMADRDTVEVAVGDEVVIRLAENGTTGYVWSLRHAGVELELVEDRLTPPDRAIGASGVRLIKLRAIAPAHAEVVLELAREWEKAPIEERRYSVVVT